MFIGFIKRRQPSLVEVRLLDVPDVVKFKYLRGGRLIPKEQVQLLHKAFDEESDNQRYSKQEVRLAMQRADTAHQLDRYIGYDQELYNSGSMVVNNDYSTIIKLNGKLYAVYHPEAIGEGSFGKVKAVQDVDTGEWFADKVQVAERGFDVKTAVQIELEALHVVEQGIGDLLERESKKTQGSKFNFLMKYAKGVELSTYFHSHPNITAIRRLDIAVQSVEELMSIHERELLHCDIKPANMKVDFLHKKVKMVDMGLALKMNENGNAPYAEVRGTHGYIAPEVLNVDKSKIVYSVATDIFSLGKVLEETLGFYIWADNAGDRQIKFLDNSPFNKEDAELANLVLRMTDDDPSKRPALKEVKERLQSLRQDFLDISIRKTGIVDVDDLVNTKDIEAFFAALKAVDTIVLVDTKKNKGDIFYTQIKRELERRGHSVEGSVLISKNPADFVEKVKSKDNANKDEVVVSHICYLHPPEKKIALQGAQSVEVTSLKKDYVMEVTKSSTIVAIDQVNKVQGALLKRASDLGEKNPNSKRVQLLLGANTRIEKAKKEGSLTYSKLSDELHQLEKDMSKARRWSFSKTDVKLVKDQRIAVKQQEDAVVHEAPKMRPR